ncbi:MAG: single-strand DNA-binding protein [Arcticibacterium sp.]|jgi:single-strand DNA-binding protein
MNTVTLVGNAGNNVEIFEFEKSKKASFSLATNERFKQNDEEKTITSWHNVIAWGKVAEQCEALISKGKFVKVEGKLVYRNYMNKENQKVYVTEIQAYKIQEVEKKA